jgi:TPR repeat protein
MSNFKIKFFLLILIKEILTQLFETNIEQINQFLDTFNSTKYNEACTEAQYEECYRLSNNIIKSNLFSDKNFHMNNKADILEYNRIIAEAYFYSGEMEYYGIFTKKPDLVEGTIKFIIASFFGDPKAYYKLSIIIETDIISTVIGSSAYNTQLYSNVHLQYISKTPFYANFHFSDEYEKSSIAFQFLYTSSLARYPTAMATLGYKYQNGYGVSKSCESASEYYKQTAIENVKLITSRRKPNYYEKINIAQTEYIGFRYSQQAEMDVDQIVDYLKVEAHNGHIDYIQQLGQRYLYGQGVPQDFKAAYYYYSMGAKMNDTTCMYYLGELYLNGWGVEKVNLTFT